jgi:chromosome segregation ATPase
MYDEVKNARNKYVKLIQNSSQELAETKERIKILQNEVEILRNESAEKDRKLKEERHHVQVSLHVRDTLRTDINKLEYQVKQKHSLMTQQVNEINKLNVIINSLEKEMINLKEKYEQVCESRNYTGIQLIDRNDELCILYEKANIQEAIQKRGENEIRGKDDEIRMLHLELSEVKRQIEVHMKQIPQVPELSAQVLALRSELDDVKAKEKELALQLEDPDNLKRFRELKGEDPDEEALEAKIQVLEERLNNKKEQLLEKELVLEEITTLADKLRSQALTGRQGTLELSERVNDFQSRIKILTRRMMATVSELSMFQATAIKLQQEKDKIEHQLQEAYSRIDSTLPPTDECQYEWERMEKHRLIKEEEHKLRKELEEEERLLPGQITRTTAEPRHNAYIPEGDRLGLPKPYGPLRPFYPSELGANTRHIRKPQPKPIEI